MSDDILEDLQAQLDEANDLIQDLEGRLNQAEEERDEAIEDKEDLEQQVCDLEGDLKDAKTERDEALALAQGLTDAIDIVDVYALLSAAFGPSLAASGSTFHGAQVDQSLSREALECLLIEACEALRLATDKV